MYQYIFITCSNIGVLTFRDLKQLPILFLGVPYDNLYYKGVLKPCSIYSGSYIRDSVCLFSL